MPSTRAAIQAAIEAAKHAADLPGTDRDWMALAITLEESAAALREFDAEVAKVITTALAAVLP